MLEKPLIPASDESAGPDGGMRAPDWAELSARFSAARDLRASLAMGGVYPAGGFARFCALGAEPVNEEPAGVNLTGLADGKDDSATLSVAEQGYPQADREMQ